jgi:2-polyprenyl-3-methyl-5-hydroxy-6-metoxy-1,4-benzoquinol methylase
MNIKGVVRGFQDSFFYFILSHQLNDSETVLDVACGSDSPLGKIKRSFKSEGIDIFEKSIKESKNKKIHYSYKTGDILKLNTFYKEKSFDSVVCLDVIEHFTKKDALKLISMMEKIAKKKVIILTPNGFYHQDHLDDNPHQEHKSGWFRKDLERLGYSVRGLRGIKNLRGECATIKYRPWIFWGMIAFISEPLLYFFPSISYHLFAVKEIQNEE